MVGELEGVTAPLKVHGHEVVPHPARQYSVYPITEEQFPGSSNDIRHEVLDVMHKVYPHLPRSASRHAANAPIDLILLNPATPESELTSAIEELQQHAELLFESLGAVVVGARKNILSADSKPLSHLAPLSSKEAVCGHYVVYLKPLDPQDLIKARKIMTDLTSGAINRHVATKLE